jgi:hypothetical protein
MTHRVLALTVAAWVISSAALVKPHCPLGEIYYRSKHACLAKNVAMMFKAFAQIRCRPAHLARVRDFSAHSRESGKTRADSVVGISTIFALQGILPSVFKMTIVSFTTSSSVISSDIFGAPSIWALIRFRAE